MSSESVKKYTVLRAVILFSVLFAVGLIYCLFGFKMNGDNSPTTMQLIASMGYVAVTVTAFLVLGITKKSGFFIAQCLFIVLSLPVIPTSRIFFSPLFSLVSAFDSGEYVIYILYSAVALIAFGLGFGLRTLISKIPKDGINIPFPNIK